MMSPLRFTEVLFHLEDEWLKFYPAATCRVNYLRGGIIILRVISLQVGCFGQIQKSQSNYQDGCQKRICAPGVVPSQTERKVELNPACSAVQRRWGLPDPRRTPRARASPSPPNQIRTGTKSNERWSRWRREREGPNRRRPTLSILEAVQVK